MNLPVLEKIGLHAHLFEKDISAQEVNINSDEVIFKSGDPCGAFLIIVSGQVRVEITTKSGRDLLLYRIGQEETCIITTSVLLNNEKYYARAITESPVRAIAIEAKYFHKALSLSHSFSNYVLNGYSQRMTALILLLDKIASRDINYELNNLLLERSDQFNTVHLTQKEIAREIGTSREVISRKLSILSDKRIVEVKRGEIIILKADYLTESISI